MTTKSRIDKLSKVIKPKRKAGRQVEVEIPINAIYDTGEQNQVMKFEESQIEEMDSILEKIYGNKDQEEKAE